MEKFPNEKDEYGVCEKCSKVNLQEVCGGCGREPSKSKCTSCQQHIGGGFVFKEAHIEGIRCFDCLMVSHEKEKGWQALDQIKEVLIDTPKLEGRCWKAYALKLREQRTVIAHIQAIYKAQKPDYIN